MNILSIDIDGSGSGIEAEHLEHIFDPFFTTKREGTGLGLSISYQLVRNNGGSIGVASEPGRGTRFAVSLPTSESQVTETPTRTLA